MIPLKDDNPRSVLPFVTIGLIVINAIVFYYEIKLGYDFSLRIMRLSP